MSSKFYGFVFCQFNLSVWVDSRAGKKKTTQPVSQPASQPACQPSTEVFGLPFSPSLRTRNI